MDAMLRQLQLTQLEILKVFDTMCRNNGLKYSLYAGSLIGAVRHNAFIPWDDDLDVCMPRADYDRFIAIWEQKHPKGFILQNKENSPSFWQSFTKLRKDHTTFLQEKREAGMYHTGIFLDIFPLDRLPQQKLKRIEFKWNVMKYQLLTREFIPKNANCFIRLGASIILICTPKSQREKVRQRALRRITRYNAQTGLEVIATETMESLQIPYRPGLLDSYIDLPFEDGMFMCFAGWEDHLRRKYGDYMQLPPEEERTWRHHPIIIDFEHNYEELNQHHEQ